MFIATLNATDVSLENLIWFTVVIKVQTSRRRSSQNSHNVHTSQGNLPNRITNVESATGTLFKFLTKISVSLRTFSLNSRHPIHLCGRLLYRTVFSVQYTRKISTTPINTVRHSQHRFSWNSSMPNAIKCGSCTQNFRETRQYRMPSSADLLQRIFVKLANAECHQVPIFYTEFSWNSSMPNAINCRSSTQNFRETRQCRMSSSANLLYKISTKSVTKYGPSVSQSMTVSSPAAFQTTTARPAALCQESFATVRQTAQSRGLYIRRSLFYFLTKGQEGSRTAAIQHLCPHTRPRHHVETPTVTSPPPHCSIISWTQRKPNWQQSG